MSLHSLHSSKSKPSNTTQWFFWSKMERHCQALDPGWGWGSGSWGQRVGAWVCSLTSCETSQQQSSPWRAGVELPPASTPELPHNDPPCGMCLSVHWPGTEPGTGAGAQGGFSAWCSQFARGYALGLADGCSVVQCCSIKALPLRLLWKQFVLFFWTGVYSGTDWGNSSGELDSLFWMAWEPRNLIFISLTLELATERVWRVERWWLIFLCRVL